MEFIAKNLEDTALIADFFASAIKDEGCFLCLYGDIGVGKTAFCKELLKKIGVGQKVTSPSFVILNEYKGNHLPVFHFDLYRLEEVGLESILPELIEYSKEKVITLVEWANFGEYELPLDRIDVLVEYNFELGENSRKFTFKARGDENERKLAKFKELMELAK